MATAAVAAALPAHHKPWYRHLYVQAPWPGPTPVRI